jgi:FeS assembly SUF system protein
MSAEALAAESPEALAAQIASVGEKVVEQCKSVFDPEIPVNIHDLGLIYKIDINPVAGAPGASGTVESGSFDIHIDMTLTTPGCPVAGSMPGMVEKAVETIGEVRSATVNLVWDPPWDKSRMTDEAKFKLNMF